MYDYTGCIVAAQAGRDKGGLFYVVGMEQDGPRLLLADGKRRRAARPKAKQLGHVQCIAQPQDFAHPVTQKLQRGETVYDRELRRALAAFKGEMKLGKR